MAISIYPVTKELWEPLEQLFGKRGACNGCWCMYWRIGAAYHKRDRLLNKEDLAQLVSSGQTPGLLAFLDDIPVGWCQLTPRHDLPWLLKSGYGSFGENDNTWCISCFYIKAGYRRQGITFALIKASIDYARKAGADILEAYPRKSQNSFTGYPSTFSKAGFELKEAGRHGKMVAFLRLKKP